MPQGHHPYKLSLLFVVIALFLAGCNAPISRPTATPTFEPEPVFEPGDFADFATPPSPDEPQVGLAPTMEGAENLLTSPTPTETQIVIDFTVIATKNANCRTGPNIVFDQYGFLLLGNSAEAIGRLADTSWLQVQLADKPSPCWIANSLLSYSFDPSLLPVLASPPTPTPALGSISGILWHEICEYTGGHAGEPLVLGNGCVQYGPGAGEWGPNQVKDGFEVGWVGVTLHLGSGACPSTGLATAVTNGSGAYSFDALAAGTYCVSYDPLGDGNDAILIPGGPTYPVRGSGGEKQTVDLDPGENATSVNFGWAWQFFD